MTAPPFRFVLRLPEGAGGERVALVRVCGVPLAARLLDGARRAGAAELWIAGPAMGAAHLAARLGRADLRTGEPPAGGLPVLEAAADVEVSPAALALLARAEGAAHLPGFPDVRKHAPPGRPEPLWTGEAPPGAFAMRVTDGPSARAAKRRVFADLTSHAASPVARRLNAPLSKALSWFLVETPLPPAAATAFHALVGVASAFFFAKGELGSLLVAGALFELASVLDGVDGELARAKRLDSLRGAWLDTAGDTVAYLAFVVALPLGYAEHAESAGLPWAPVVPALGLSLVGASVGLVASMGMHAARAGLGGSMSGIADALGAELRRRSRALGPVVELGRRALFSKIVALLAVLAAVTGRGAFYDALFFGTLGVVLAIAGSFAAWTGRSRRLERRTPERLTSRRAGA